MLPIFFAPLQGFTDATYRRAHAHAFGGVATYYAPFARFEHGEVRRKDLRDVAPEANDGIDLLPQLIAPDARRALPIVEALKAQGHKRIDINLGCPFPLLAKRRNGSGLLPYPADVEALLTALIETHPDVAFSVKLRLGWESADECLALLPLLNALPLTQICLHPRLGKQQYKGEVDLNAFTAFYEGCEKPLIYNGDLLTVDDVRRIETRFPKLAGIAIGRGLLANPALALEYAENRSLTPAEMQEKVRAMHTEVLAAYRERLEGGDGQILTKMQAFWQYLLPEADRKARKTIHKTSKLNNYLAAANELMAKLK